MTLAQDGLEVLVELGQETGRNIVGERTPYYRIRVMDLQKAGRGLIGAYELAFRVMRTDQNEAILHQITISIFALAQRLFRLLTSGDVNEALQKKRPSPNGDRLDGLDNRNPLALDRQQHAFGVINLLLQVGNRAAPLLRGTNEFVTHGSDHRFTGRANQIQSWRVGLNNPVRGGIDEEDARLYPLENDLKLGLTGADGLGLLVHSLAQEYHPHCATQGNGRKDSEKTEDSADRQPGRALDHNDILGHTRPNWQSEKLEKKD